MPITETITPITKRLGAVLSGFLGAGKTTFESGFEQP